MRVPFCRSNGLPSIRKAARPYQKTALSVDRIYREAVSPTHTWAEFCKRFAVSPIDTWAESCKRFAVNPTHTQDLGNQISVGDPNVKLRNLLADVFWLIFR